MKVMTFEQYAASQGASRQDYGDAGLHKTNARLSKKQWGRKVEAQRRRDAELYRRREELYEAYQDMVRSGDVRPPSRLERLRSTASGHPDNESTRAAKRLLKKMEV